MSSGHRIRSDKVLVRDCGWFSAPIRSRSPAKSTSVLRSQQVISKRTMRLAMAGWLAAIPTKHRTVHHGSSGRSNIKQLRIHRGKYRWHSQTEWSTGVRNSCAKSSSRLPNPLSIWVHINRDILLAVHGEASRPQLGYLWFAAARLLRERPLSTARVVIFGVTATNAIEP